LHPDATCSATPWLDEFMETALGKSHAKDLVRVPPGLVVAGRAAEAGAAELYSGSTGAGAGAGPVAACRAHAFSMGHTARLSSVIGFVHEVERCRLTTT